MLCKINHVSFIDHAPDYLKLISEGAHIYCLDDIIREREANSSFNFSKIGTPKKFSRRREGGGGVKIMILRSEWTLPLVIQ